MRHARPKPPGGCTLDSGTARMKTELRVALGDRLYGIERLFLGG